MISFKFIYVFGRSDITHNILIIKKINSLTNNTYISVYLAFCVSNGLLLIIGIVSLNGSLLR